MNKTKEAIRDFIGKPGHHETTVHESVEPAVKREEVKATEHEEINTAVNKEIHQDHYHRTVQPVHDKEVLPEQHQHRVGAVQHKDYDHRDHEATKRALATENAKLKDERIVHDTTHTQSRAPTVQGENVHHHVHETIQPVVHKETIQPSVVHTTVPVHETHHNPAQHHSTTSLPPVSMDEFKHQGGASGGRQERFNAFEGEPKSIHGTLSNLHDKREPGLKEAPDGVFHGDFDPLDGGRHHTLNSGPNIGKTHGQSGTTQGVIGTTRGATQGETQSMSTQSSAQREYRDAGRGGVASTTGTGSNGRYAHDENLTNTTSKKEGSSLLNKLNPMTDSNGDGKAGFMK